LSSAAITPESIESQWSLPYKGYVGMYCLIIAESSIFAIFVIAYIYYIGKSLSGPTPKQVLDVPVFASICLWTSSLTIHFATVALRRGNHAVFRLLWLLTLALGATFLAYTGVEWHRLIYHNNLTIRTNLFGTTFYSLVGLHAFHVTVGIIGLATILLLAISGKIQQQHMKNVDTFAIYWHFVDAVWVVVFTLVYIVGR
jgi:cytochrome c oxidase subunit III